MARRLLWLLPLLCGCTTLADPRRVYLDCYEEVKIVIETELHVEAYCWARQPFPWQFCTVGDTIVNYRLDHERAECFVMPVPPWP